MAKRKPKHEDAMTQEDVTGMVLLLEIKGKVWESSVPPTSWASVLKVLSRFGRVEVGAHPLGQITLGRKETQDAPL